MPLKGSGVKDPQRPKHYPLPNASARDRAPQVTERPLRYATAPRRASQMSAICGSIQRLGRSDPLSHGHRSLLDLGRKIRETVRTELPEEAPDERRSGRKGAEMSTIEECLLSIKC